ncbi:hypothetical protein E2R28_20275 [Burkholderia pseudomallei]|nr:hypothetical protein E2R28_20275 [Burkholderia pseudomallei]QBP63884.1 hypothetical protein E2R29_20215 [Burkholderia pseudomallei]
METPTAAGMRPSENRPAAGRGRIEAAGADPADKLPTAKAGAAWRTRAGRRSPPRRPSSRRRSRPPGAPSAVEPTSMSPVRACVCVSTPLCLRVAVSPRCLVASSPRRHNAFTALPQPHGRRRAASRGPCPLRCPRHVTRPARRSA